MKSSRRLAKHIRHVHQIVALLSCTGGTPRLYKRCFSKDTTNYLGDVIQTKQNEIASLTVNIIRGPNPPALFLQLSSFLRHCPNFWRLVSNFSGVASQLNKTVWMD